MTTSRASGASAMKRLSAGTVDSRYRRLMPDPVHPTTKGPSPPGPDPDRGGGTKRAVSMAVHTRSTAGAIGANHSARKSLPASTHAARPAMARVARSWPGDRSHMASSTSKNTGRCRAGSSVRWPGSTSRSSHVASARHVRAATGRRAASFAAVEGGPCQRRRHLAAGHVARDGGVLGDPRGTRPHLDAEVAAGRTRAAGRGNGSTPATGPTAPPPPVRASVIDPGTRPTSRRR